MIDHKPVPGMVAVILENMALTLAHGADWTRRASARNSDGLPCDACSPCAVAWCLSGPLDRELGRIADAVLRTFLSETADDLLLTTARERFDLPGLQSLQQFNDDRSTIHRDVIALIGATLACMPMPPAATYERWPAFTSGSACPDIASRRPVNA